MNWYAIHTKPRQETVAQRNLLREGVETFYPKLRRRRTIRRVRRWVTESLFPNYIFARFDTAKAGRLVKYANGVTNIVSFGGKPAVVEPTIIDEIGAHAENDVVVIQSPELKPGDVVEIKEGPLAGIHGIFEREMPSAQRVVLLLQTLASAARVQVPIDSVEKIS